MGKGWRWAYTSALLMGAGMPAQTPRLLMVGSWESNLLIGGLLLLLSFQTPRLLMVRRQTWKALEAGRGPGPVHGPMGKCL